MTVTTLPNGPIPLESYVTLTCAIDPVPPGLLSYVWYSTFYQIIQGPPTVTVQVYNNGPNPYLYFCHVLSDGIEVAVGYSLIRPQGRILASS